MKRVVVPAGLFLLVLLASSTSFALGREFVSEAGRFSVVTPLTLNETSQTVDTKAGKILLYLFGGEQGDIACFVAYADYPETYVQSNDPETLLDGGRDGAVRNVKGTLVKEIKIKLDGYPGRELLVNGTTADGKDFTVKQRMFLVKNRLYQVITVTPKGDTSRPELDEFLNSLKLLSK